ncbi:MAG: hypothetical protein KDD64_14850 [Bdellovibrionales bacterium]|nr:hypothetical protein [Bdellovibrionales bacterium]
MHAEQWIQEINRSVGELDKTNDPVNQMYKHMCSPDELREIMLSQVQDQVTANQDRVLPVIKEGLMRSLFRHAAQGKTFGPESRIKEVFGKNVQDNYGIANGPFINVAKAYWSFRAEVQDVPNEAPGSLLLGVLAYVEQTFASVFFPTPGPVSLPTSLRRQTQKELIQKYAPEMDVESYLEQNPMLKESESMKSLGRFVGKVVSSSFLVWFAWGTAALIMIAIGFMIYFGPASR